MFIRNYRIGEEMALHDVFYSSVHQLGKNHYTAEQLAAWAPGSCDQEVWVRRIGHTLPFVAEISRQIVGYADLQVNGYIDHFFVAGSYSRRGVGTALMEHIHSLARERGIFELTSDVSLSAEQFFARHGFSVIERQTPVIGGVTLANSRMRKKLDAI